jgi:hypothetical protein
MLSGLTNFHLCIYSVVKTLHVSVEQSKQIRYRFLIIVLMMFYMNYTLNLYFPIK